MDCHVCRNFYFIHPNISAKALSCLKSKIKFEGFHTWASEGFTNNILPVSPSLFDLPVIIILQQSFEPKHFTNLLSYPRIFTIHCLLWVLYYRWNIKLIRTGRFHTFLNTHSSGSWFHSNTTNNHICSQFSNRCMILLRIDRDQQSIRQQLKLEKCYISSFKHFQWQVHIFVIVVITTRNTKVISSTFKPKRGLFRPLISPRLHQYLWKKWNKANGVDN